MEEYRCMTGCVCGGGGGAYVMRATFNSSKASKCKESQPYI